MRLRTYKMDTALYSKLRKINENTDEAIRTLFSNLRNEALAMWQNDYINECMRQIEKNTKEIEDIPRLKEESKATLKDETKLKVENVKLQIKAIELKIKYPKIMLATREYETYPEWAEIEKQDYLQALEGAKKHLKKLQETFDSIDKVYEDSTEYQEKIELLKKQNDRLLMEIERAQKILANQDLLDLKKETEASYIG